MFQISTKLSILKNKLKKWNTLHFGNIFAQKSHLEVQLQAVEAQLQHYWDPSLQAQEQHLLNDLNNLYFKEELHWKQKSRVNWLKEGDKNTRYFHLSTLAHRAQNRINSLDSPNGETLSTSKEIYQHITSFYQSLLSEDPINRDDAQLSFLQHTPTLVTPSHNTFLCSPISEDEVEKALFSMKPFGAPGPDGFPPGFLQHFWYLLKKDLTELVQESFQSKQMLGRINHTFLTVIPKTENAKTIDSFRPISLCNAIYKLVSKVATNRFKRILPNIITEEQKAFIKNRHLLDGLTTIHELLHSLQRYNRKGLLLKLDMKKAFDRINWSFLQKLLLQPGFEEAWVSWLSSLFMSPSFSILINGSSRGYFHSQRGLKQGDPLSPYLFIIVADALNHSISTSHN